MSVVVAEVAAAVVVVAGTAKTVAAVKAAEIA